MVLTDSERSVVHTVVNYACVGICPRLKSGRYFKEVNQSCVNFYGRFKRALPQFRRGKRVFDRKFLELNSRLGVGIHSALKKHFETGILIELDIGKAVSAVVFHKNVAVSRVL